MYPKIKGFQTLPDYMLKVVFDDGKIVLYDVKDDMSKIPSYTLLKDVYKLFEQARLDSSRSIIYWNDEMDLPSDAIYKYGKNCREDKCGG